MGIRRTRRARHLCNGRRPGDLPMVVAQRAAALRREPSATPYVTPAAVRVTRLTASQAGQPGADGQDVGEHEGADVERRRGPSATAQPRRCTHSQAAASPREGEDRAAERADPGALRDAEPGGQPDRDEDGGREAGGRGSTSSCRPVSPMRPPRPRHRDPQTAVLAAPRSDRDARGGSRRRPCVRTATRAPGGARGPRSEVLVGSGGAEHGLDLELDVDLVADDDAAAVHGHLDVDAELRAGDLGLGARSRRACRRRRRGRSR